MDFDKPKVYGDTSINDGLVFFMHNSLRTSNKKPGNRTKESSQISKIGRSENSKTPERHKSEGSKSRMSKNIAGELDLVLEEGYSRTQSSNEARGQLGQQRYTLRSRVTILGKLANG